MLRVQEQTGTGITTYDELLLAPHWEWLRGRPEFAELAAPSRHSFEMMLEAFERAREAGELPGYLEAPLEELVQELASHGDDLRPAAGASST